MHINVLDYLVETTSKYPEKTFLVSGNKKYSFLEVLYFVNRISTLINSENIFDKPIPVINKSDADSIVVFLSIVASGNFYCPIDFSSAPDRATNVMNNLDVNLYFSDCQIDSISNAKYYPLSPSKCLDKLTPADLTKLDLQDEIQVLKNKIKNRIDTDPAYIIHTSGSTGTPKGVVISNRSILDYIEWAKKEFGHNQYDKILNQAPFYFDNSTLDIYLALSVGAELHIVEEGFYVFPAKIIEYINEFKITSVFWVPSILVNIANLKFLDRMQVNTLNKILFAGEVMPVPQINYWIQKIPSALFANLYGPTEITVDCTFFKMNGQWTSGDSLPIGIPCRNSGILILNESDEPCGTNEIGELCVRGTSLALGYWKLPEKTNEVFCQNPLIKEYRDLMYRTGDLVKSDEKGLIYFAGRKDSQIKHNGYRIELGELEAAMTSLQNILSAVVLYQAKKKKIVAFYKSEVEIRRDDFISQLEGKLPNYMIPHQFVKKDDFPLNKNGKVDRHFLMKHLDEMDK